MALVLGHKGLNQQPRPILSQLIVLDKKTRRPERTVSLEFNVFDDSLQSSEPPIPDANKAELLHTIFLPSVFEIVLNLECRI
jgi:hypothetical protein